MSVTKNVNVCVATAQRFPVEVDADRTGQKGHQPPQPSSANIIRPPPPAPMTSTIVQGAWQSRQSMLDQTWRPARPRSPRAAAGLSDGPERTAESQAAPVASWPG